MAILFFVISNTETPKYHSVKMCIFCLKSTNIGRYWPSLQIHPSIEGCTADRYAVCLQGVTECTFNRFRVTLCRIRC